MDFSTINLKALSRLRQYKLPPAYHLQKGSGNGCAGDPPGFPTYFTRSVYTQSGSSRRGSPQQVISFQGVLYVTLGDDDSEKAHDRYMRLWKPLPLDHERTRLWIASTYSHHQHCYTDAERPEYGRPGCLVYPVPYYKLKSFTDDPRFSDEYRTAARAEVDAFNRQERERADKIAIPENHQAVRIIRRFYPEHVPDLDLIDNPPKITGQWWETEPTQPSEENCARTQRWNNKHPFNVMWCQWCGRSYPAAE